jgi:hypothetical protein
VNPPGNNFSEMIEKLRIEVRDLNPEGVRTDTMSVL